MSARSLSIPESENLQRSSQGTARQIVVKPKDISRFRSLVSSPIKGIAKGLVDVAKIGYRTIIDPTNAVGKHIEPLFEKAEGKIEKNIPTHPEFLEKGLERTGRIAVPALIGGAGSGTSLLSTGVRSAAAGFGGQAVEEAGGGDFLQAAAETLPFIVPGLGRKIVPSDTDQKRILDLGRKYGMSEEQLAPLMPGTKKRRFFGRYAFAGESAQEPLKESVKGIQNIYQVLETSPQAKNTINKVAANEFAREVNDLTHKMPHSVRSQIKQDAQDLVNSAQRKGGITGDELINFYHDISSRYNIGRPQLELLKEPVMKALHSLDPALARDFSTANRMYQKAAQMGRILRPSEFEHLISLGEAYEVGASAATLDLGRLQRLLGMVGFRKLSEKMLTSPRLQNMIEKSQQAIKDHNFVILKKIGDLIISEFQEDENQE